MKNLKFLKNRNGKTLLEIILVVTIVAVLAAVAVPQMQQNSVNKKIASAKLSLIDIADAIRIYDQRFTTPLSTAGDSVPPASPTSALQILSSKGLIYYVDSTKNDFDTSKKKFIYNLTNVGITTDTITAVSTFTPTKTITYTLVKANRSADTVTVNPP